MTRPTAGRTAKRRTQRRPDVEPENGVRLWTPWRMRYVGGGAKEDGCVFCNRLRAEDDVESLILFRSPNTFAILNLFPYSTGHLMLVPNVHVDSPEAAPAEALAELALALKPTLRALRRVLGCHGFNVGFNVGGVAGAGVAEHLHQHVVPRWTGDANFMPILAATMVMPELIPVTYAKIRAELERELALEEAIGAASGVTGGQAMVSVVVLTPDRRAVLTLERDGGLSLPTAIAEPDEAVWRTAVRAVEFVPGGVDLAGWAGPKQAGGSGPIALTVQARDPSARAIPPGHSRWLAIDQIEDRSLAPAARRSIRCGLAQLANEPAT